VSDIFKVYLYTVSVAVQTKLLKKCRSLVHSVLFYQLCVFSFPISYGIESRRKLQRIVRLWIFGDRSAPFSWFVERGIVDRRAIESFLWSRSL